MALAITTSESDAINNATVNTTNDYKVGDEVEIKIGKKWLPGHVLKLNKKTAKVQLHDGTEKSKAFSDLRRAEVVTVTNTPCIVATVEKKNEVEVQNESTIVTATEIPMESSSLIEDPAVEANVDSAFVSKVNSYLDQLDTLEEMACSDTNASNLGDDSQPSVALETYSASNIFLISQPTPSKFKVRSHPSRCLHPDSSHLCCMQATTPFSKVRPSVIIPKSNRAQRMREESMRKKSLTGSFVRSSTVNKVSQWQCEVIVAGRE